MLNRLNSIRMRILALILLVIIVILVATLFVVRTATYDHSTNQLLTFATSSKAVVRDKIINRATLLQNAVTDLSKTFSVIELVAGANEDKASLDSAMRNYQRRFDVDLYQVLDGNGQLLVGSRDEPLPVEINALVENQINWYQVQGQYYLLKAAPVKFVPTSRQIQGWLVMGVEADKLINAELAELAGFQVSLLHNTELRQMIGSTLPPVKQQQLQVNALVLDDELHQIKLGDESYVYGVQQLVQDSPFLIILATNEDQAFLSYNSLIGQLIAVLLLAGFLALLAAVVMARTITNPVNTLVHAANKIRHGEYASEFPQTSTNEVDTLSFAIKEMQEGIMQREEKINELAYFDKLTGLPNRNQFNEYLSQAIADCSDSVVLVALLNVDRFKDINDTVGHATGDILLRQIAERLSSFHNGEDFFAHTGGDEFGLIVKGPKSRQALVLASDLAQVFERPFNLGGLVLDVNVSTGLAVYPNDANSAQELMQSADIALHACKGHHYSYCIYKPELNKHSMQRLNLMSELKEALAAGQLTLYYQPKLSIEHHQIESVECLIRWIHPVNGFIPPDEFIGLAEQTGAIRDVTHWGLRTALTQQRAWIDAGYHINVAVNISAVDLVDMKLPAYVSELLSEFDVDPSMLTLEVTESAVMSDPESALKALNTLRRMGIVLSIDDFGTGFSSMAQLKKMPVDELKIDKAFVLELASNTDDQEMVKTLVTLAQNLGLKTVAEGVEDANSLDFLKQIGCTKAQGFYLSKPLPQEQFDKWIADFSSPSRQDHIA